MTIFQPTRLAALVMACAVAVASPARRADAQNQGEPALVVSIASSDELLSDINYLLGAGGVPQYGAMISLFAGPFIQELDGTKPSGVLISFEGMEPKALGFLPVKNLNTLLQKVEDQVGRPEDAGNGIKKIGLDRPMFLKESGGYVFISDSQIGLGGVPSNPAGLLGGLEKTYDISVRLKVRNIPEPMRNMAVSEMRSAFERQMAEQQADTPADLDAQEKMGRNAINALVRMVEETDELVFGWSIDRENKTTFLDFSLTAVTGSELADSMALMRDSATNFGGFLMPNAAVTYTTNSKFKQSDSEQALVALDAMAAQAKSSIDKDDALPDEAARQAAKGIIDRLTGVLKKTLQGGVMDLGAALVLDSGSPQFFVGGRVLGGADLEQALREALVLAKDQENVPQVNFNVATHQGVAMHTMTVPISPDDDAHRIFGDGLDVTLGIGAESVYVAVGNSNMEALKKIIDQAGTPVEAPPTKLELSLKKIMQYAANLEDSPQIKAMNDALAGAGDKVHVRITAKPIERGAMTRVEIEEGVLQAIGRGVAAFAQDGGGGF